MRKVMSLVVIVLALLLVGPRLTTAQDARGSGNGNGVTGKWNVNADFWGTPLYFRLELKEEGGKLTGEFSGDKLEGTVSGNTVHFLAKDEGGGTEECMASIKDGLLTGTIVFTGSENPEHPATHSFTANRTLERRAGAPSHYYNHGCLILCGFRSVSTKLVHLGMRVGVVPPGTWFLFLGHTPDIRVCVRTSLSPLRGWSRGRLQ